MSNKPFTLSFFLFVIISTSACSTVRRGAIYATGAAAGTAAGYYYGDKDPLWTAGGALIGTGVAAIGNGVADHEVKQAEEKGYERGNGDAIKRHYWMLQANQQRNTEQSGVTNTYDVTVPGTRDAYGTSTMSRTATIRIVE